MKFNSIKQNQTKPLKQNQTKPLKQNQTKPLKQNQTKPLKQNQAKPLNLKQNTNLTKPQNDQTVKTVPNKLSKKNKMLDEIFNEIQTFIKNTSSDNIKKIIKQQDFHERQLQQQQYQTRSIIKSNHYFEKDKIMTRLNLINNKLDILLQYFNMIHTEC